MNNFELCEAVSNLHVNILGTALLDEGKMIAGFSKPNVALPNEQRFREMLF
jgi:hypothetical protein